MTPAVTILIPTFNREKFILEALSCAAAQTFSNIEILVTDNCSTDSTTRIVLDFAKNDPRVRLIKNDQNLGPLLNWKRGIEAASCEFVKILWSDDLMQENFLEETVPLLLDDVGFVISPICIGESWENAKAFEYDLFTGESILSNQFIERSLTGASIPVSPGCSLFRKKDLLKNLTLENVLFESDRFMLNGAGPDLLFFLKTCLDYPKIGYANATKSFFRDHPGSITVGEKARLIGLDYLKAKLLFTHLISHRFYHGISLEIFLRDKKAWQAIRENFFLGFTPLVGICEYVFWRGVYILKRKIK